MRRVKTNWVINLQPGSRSRVKVGEVVVCGQILVEEVGKNEKIINIATELKGWSEDEVKKLEMEMVGKKITKGEVIYKTRGIFSKKIEAPVSAEVIKMDEFKNLYLRVPVDKVGVITSPTEARVVAVKTDSLELEFRADEFGGVGLNNDRAWGVNGLKWVETLGDLSFADEGKVMVIKSIYPEFLAKAEVVGIKGVVMTLKSDDLVNSKLPILVLNLEEVEELKKEGQSKKRVLLNAGSGRLLLVI